MARLSGVLMSCVLAAAVGLDVRVGRLVPADVQAERIRAMNPSAGTASGADKGEACGLMSGCADIRCDAPFKIKRLPGQCCPTCQASEEDVAVDRHVAMKGPSKYATKQAPTAPVTCKGAKCFKQMCMPGFKPGIAPNACCLSCRPE